MKEFKLVVKVGDLIEVGRFRNVSTKIKKMTKSPFGSDKFDPEHCNGKAAKAMKNEQKIPCHYTLFFFLLSPQ